MRPLALSNAPPSPPSSPSAIELPFSLLFYLTYPAGLPGCHGSVSRYSPHRQRLRSPQDTDPPGRHFVPGHSRHSHDCTYSYMTTAVLHEYVLEGGIPYISEQPWQVDHGPCHPSPRPCAGLREG